VVYPVLEYGLNQLQNRLLTLKIMIMKTLGKLLFFLACIGFLAGCQKDGAFEEMPVLKSANNSAQGLDQYRSVFLKDYDNLKVNYRIIGKGPIRMVFVPGWTNGWTNSLEVYSKQFDYFRDKARCIYIDLPGHGNSDAPTPNNPLNPDSEGLAYTQELMVEAIKTVVKKEGLKKFIAVGFSWSGTALKLFEMKYPGMIQQLILLDISTPTWPPITQAGLEGEFGFFSSLNYDQKIAMLPAFIPPATAPADLWEFGQQFGDFPSLLMANMRYHWQAEENCQPYPWEIPILVIYNAMNATKEAKTLLHYPGCEIVVLDGDWHEFPYQHVIQWAYQDVVNQLMDDFIEDRPGRKY
jgi:pimeloyl-ACP methyl ester carboxylesterase